MLEAIHIASGDVIIEFKADGNSIPADIPRIVAKMHEGYDLVIGSRYREGAKSDDDDWMTATGNWMFTLIVNVLFRTQYTDVLIGFRAYRREQALRLDLDAPGLSWPCQSFDPVCAGRAARHRDFGARAPEDRRQAQDDAVSHRVGNLQTDYARFAVVPSEVFQGKPTVTPGPRRCRQPSAIRASEGRSSSCSSARSADRRR